MPTPKRTRFLIHQRQKRRSKIAKRLLRKRPDRSGQPTTNYERVTLKQAQFALSSKGAGKHMVKGVLFEKMPWGEVRKFWHG